MLRELSIENLAVIEKADVRFGERFNVFTGETGAGKSILIGGINAVLGLRTSKDIVRAGTEAASVSAVFDELPAAVSDKLRELGIDEEEQLLLSRRVSADGKSTARINGKPATISMLKEVGELLVDIHGQHETRILMSEDSRRDILDGYAGLAEELADYRAIFREFSRTSKQLKALSEQSADREFKAEKLNAAVEELSALDLAKGDGDRLERELEECRSAAKTRAALNGAYELLDGEDASALDMIKQAASLLSELPSCEGLSERLLSASAELDDVSTELMRLSEAVDGMDEAALSDRVSAIKHAKRKYNLDSDGLVDYLEQCRAELEGLESLDDDIDRLSAKKHELAERVKAAAERLSQHRSEAARRLSSAVCEQLDFLNMPGVRIFFEVCSDKITVNGRDRVELMFSANEGEEPKPITKIASGGELSRIMLAIKSVLADVDDIPTLIFDEIDSGISGRAAQRVGVRLSQTAEKRQVICITHLAQIASLADVHLLIEKETAGGRTFTNVTELDRHGRTREIARIIGGGEKSFAAAEEMLAAKLGGE